MKVNFITNVPQHEASGGFSGMCQAAWEVLSRNSQATYIGPISPPPLFAEHVYSKLQEWSGAGRNFFHYSEARLNRFQIQTGQLLAGRGADLNFFHGFTPWIKVRSNTPYVAWSDCTFSQYMETFHDPSRFSKRSLSRICEQEANWLRKASSVWFRSRFAAKGAIEEYGLDPAKVRVTGNYGRISLPDHDEYRGGRELLFISTDFGRKGGELVVEAVERILPDYPDLQLIIIGDSPSKQILRKCFVHYTGYLRKDVPVQFRELQTRMSKALALIHPSSADTNPMVIIEAGYHGCPSVASSIFAIPELVRQGTTGILLNDHKSVEEIATSISRLLSDEEAYVRMRAQVWHWTREEYSRERFELRFEELLAAIPGMGP